MDWNGIFVYTTIVMLALAIFAVGLPFLPIELIFHAFAHRKPKPREIAMIGRFLGVVSLFALVVLIVYIPLTLVKLSFMIANVIATTFPCHQMMMRNIFAVVITLILLGLLAWLIKYLWRKSKQIKFEPTDTQKMMTELKGLRRDFSHLSNALRELTEELKKRNGKGK